MGKDHLKLLNNLQQHRKAANLTQQELSEAAEVSRKSIQCHRERHLYPLYGIGPKNCKNH